MSFSPYTLNGHQFTGMGIELSPARWRLSAMGGRLLRKVEIDASNPAIRPNYERWGYGVKAGYDGEKFSVGGTIFTARDKQRDISFDADALGIYPKGNIAIGVEGSLNVIKDLKLSLEYGLSIMQRDLRTKERNHYHAFKADLTYSLLGNTIGIGYERISPDYETLWVHITSTTTMKT